MEETNVLRIFEQKIVRKICGCVKEESWRLRTNKEIKDILQGQKLPDCYGMVTLKECQNKMQQLKWKEQGKKEDHVKDGGKRMKRI